MTISSGETRLKIAVVGTGVSGLSAAWLLSQAHDVTVYESLYYLGGHSTVEVVGAGGRIAVDTGFIVYNEPAYPNLTELFRALGTPTRPSEMTFAVSIGGALEYAGNDLFGLFAQKRNIFSVRFWSMLFDLRRFYAEARRDLPRMGTMTLGAYLDAHAYGGAFRDDHLYPMAAAVWSAPAQQIADHPAAAFVRLCDNHGLLQITRRPIWRTVVGGSRVYVKALSGSFSPKVRLDASMRRVTREADRVIVEDRGGAESFDHVVIAAHADQALAMLADPTSEERRILGCFRYDKNETLLHGDTALMPRRRAVWSSWNYLAPGAGANERLSVTYWMNRLQGLPNETPLFVTLNPPSSPALIYRRQTYEHPIFDVATLAAQDELWSLQGRRRTWFCGAYFGAGFHEDGLQAGLAVAEQLGGVRRPWRVANKSGRIRLGAPPLIEPARTAQI